MDLVTLACDPAYDEVSDYSIFYRKCSIGALIVLLYINRNFKFNLYKILDWFISKAYVHSKVEQYQLPVEPYTDQLIALFWR